MKNEFQDNLLVTDRKKQPTDCLRNYLGCQKTAFLVGGGPSAKTIDISQIEQRGVFSLAVNNMAAHYRASAFVCSDPPEKFHDGIWKDPATMKFIPTPKLRRRRGNLRKKVGQRFEKLAICTEDCPNVWGFERRSWFQTDDTFFTEPSAAWGNHDAGVIRTGLDKTVCTLLLGIRLLYYLGARKIYLVGVDFGMDPSKSLNENYAFPEQRDDGAIRSNNEQYAIVNKWLCIMQQNKIFQKFGLEIYNTNQNSHLRAFAHVPYHLAVSDALKDYPKSPFDLENWYRK